MKQKAFDAVEMMHEGQRLIQESLANLSPEEQLAWWAEGTRQLREKQAMARARAAAAAQVAVPMVPCH